MDIEASCVLLQKLGKKLESRKAAKSEEKNSSFDSHMKRLAEIEKTLKQSRLKYIIINLFEQQKNGWPESKSTKEGPKKLEDIRQDIEKEKFGQSSKRYHYQDDYEDYEEHHKVVYKKKNHSSNTYALLSHNEEEKEDDFDKGEILEKVDEHLQNYMEGKGGSFDIFKPLSKHKVEASELVLRIFSTITSNSSLLQKVQNAKDTFIKYLFATADEKIYQHGSIIRGLNKYIQANYENDAEENQNLDGLLAVIYTKSYNNHYCELKDLSFYDKIDEEMMEPYLARIKLGVKILSSLSGVDAAKLKKFFKEKIEPMVKATDPEEIDEEMMDNVKKLFDDSSTGKTSKEEKKSGLTDFGYEVMNSVLNDNKLKVSVVYEF